MAINLLSEETKEAPKPLNLLASPPPPKPVNLLTEFDSESEGYDETTADLAGLPKGHRGRGSLDPKTGMVLKGRKHPTWDLMEEEEQRRGSKIVKKGDRYFSVPKSGLERFIEKNIIGKKQVMVGADLPSPEEARKTAFKPLGTDKELEFKALPEEKKTFKEKVGEFLGKVGFEDYFPSPKTQQAEADAIYQLSKITGVPPHKVMNLTKTEKAEFVRNLGIPHDITDMEFARGLLTQTALTFGAMAGPLPLLKGLLKYQILHQGISAGVKLSTGQDIWTLDEATIADWAGPNATPDQREALELLQLGVEVFMIPFMNRGAFRAVRQSISREGSALVGKGVKGIKKIGGVAKDTAVEMVRFTADKVHQKISLNQAKADFIKQFTPKIGKQQATRAANQIIRAIRDMTPGQASNADYLAQQLFGLGSSEVTVSGEIITKPAGVKTPKAKVTKPVVKPGKFNIYDHLKIDATGKPIKGGLVTVTSSSGKIGQKANETGLKGLLRATADAVINLASKHKIPVTITSGTEVGHKEEGEVTHSKGRKVDIRLEENLNKVITSWEKTGQRTNIKGEIEVGYKDPDSTAIWWREGNHWDVEVPDKVSKPPVKVGKEKPKVKKVKKRKDLQVLPEKEQLLVQIDEAIAKAPTKEEAGTKVEKITFETDGEAVIFNTKEALTLFRDKIAKAPATIKETKAPKAPPGSTAGKKEDIGELVKNAPKGYFTDGKLIIKGKAPKKAKYGTRDFKGKDEITKFLKAPTNPAEFIYYFIKSSDRELEGKSDRPIASVKTYGETTTGKVLFKTEDGYYTYDQDKFNAIRNRYPNATYGINKEQKTLIAYYQGQPVAVLMPVLTEGTNYAELPMKNPPLKLDEVKKKEEKKIKEKKGIEVVSDIEEIEMTKLKKGDKFIVKDEDGEEKTYTFLKSYDQKTKGKPQWDRKVYSFNIHDDNGHLVGGYTYDVYLNEPKTEKIEGVNLLEEKGVNLLADPEGFGYKIDRFEKEEIVPGPIQVPASEFKLFERVKTLIHKYANKFGEKYHPKKTLGVYYTKTTNIFLQAINNLSVAVHEVVHYVDKNTNFFADKIMRTIGTTATGNPIYDPETLKMRQNLTSIYVQYYPGGMADHKLKKRVTEGIAVFIQHMVTHPTSITEQYPYLVDNILKPNGAYYEQTFVDLIKDGRDIIRDYQALDPLQKVGAKVITDTQEESKNQFINPEDKILSETLDKIAVLEKLNKQGGVWFTEEDSSLWARFYANVASVVMKNIIGKRGYWTLDDNGKLYRKFDYNWKTLVNKLKSSANLNDFANWLVARQQTFSYDYLEELRKKAVEAANAVEKLRQELGASFATYVGVKKVIQAAKDALEEYRHLEMILAKDNFDHRVVQQAYREHRERFAEEVKMYDSLVRADLDLMANPLVQLLLPKQYEELSGRVGYTPLKRDLYNDILGVPPASVPVKNIKVGKQISSLLPRKGSELSIINPLYQSIIDHREIFIKSVRQIVYNKVAKLAPKFPDLFQDLKLVRAVDKQRDKKGRVISTRISYPQERDPNIMMVRENGRRKPYLVSKEIKTVIDECLTYENVHLIEQVFTGASRVFTKGTTGMYPWFAVSNFIVDQVTATVQSLNKFVPFFSPVRQAIKMLVNFQGEEATYFKEYLELGGERQTLVGFLDATPHDIFRILNAEKKALERFVDMLKAGVELTAEVLSTLSKYSELITRGTDYIMSRQKGETQLAALEHAGRVTAPFHHIGRHTWKKKGSTVGRSFIRSLPFFNASLEVLAQFGRTLGGGKGGPGTTTAEKEALKTQQKAYFVWSALTLAIVGSFAYLYKKATEEQKQLYKNLTPTELINYIWLPALNGKDLLRLRVPEQMAVVGGIINMIIANRLMDTAYTAKEYIEGLTAWIPDQINVTDPYRAILSSIPQILKPIGGIITEKRFYPRVAPLESQGMKAVRPGERVTETTSAFAKRLGQQLDISPVKIDFLIEGYLGRAMRIFIGKDPGNPLLRKFYFRAGRNLQFFYHARERNKWDYNDIKTGKLDANSPKGQKVLETYGKVKNIEAYLEAYRQLSVDKETDKDNPDLLDLRTQILDEIDAFKIK